VALAGKSGKGKSTLINTIRGLKPNDPNAAKVGAVETTTDPAPYSFPGSEEILLWDLPGSETPNYPLDTYVSRLGLRYFDAVIIVSAGPLHEGDLRLMNEVKKHGVPFYFVRNQVNLDVRYQEEDYDIPAEETLQKIASGMKKNGVMAPYLVNAKNLKQFDGPKLVRDIGNTIAKDRTTDTSAEGQLSNKPRKLDAYPKPSFLKEKGDGKINVALAGKSGKGKSTLINTIRGLKPNDPNAAKVGAVETTTDPAPYSFPGSEEILLWDLPGSETPNYPLDTYVSRLGLRYFDAVIIVSAGPLHEGDLRLMNEVKKHGVPFYFVRNQVNLDVRYQEEDYDIPAEETLQKIASGMKKNGVMAPYLVNAKNLKQFDGPKLVRDIGNTIAKDRATKN